MISDSIEGPQRLPDAYVLINKNIMPDGAGICMGCDTRQGGHQFPRWRTCRNMLSEPQSAPVSNIHLHKGTSRSLPTSTSYRYATHGQSQELCLHRPSQHNTSHTLFTAVSVFSIIIFSKIGTGSALGGVGLALSADADLHGPSYRLLARSGFLARNTSKLCILQTKISHIRIG